MTPAEWVAIVEWIETRYPTTQWNAEQAVAYYEDAQTFDASDVWDGLYAYYGRGEAFPPNGSQLVANAQEARRASAIQDRYDQAALPEPVETEVKPLESWLNKWYPTEQVSWTEHIRRNHRKRDPNCVNRFCDVHQKDPVQL